ncbi:calcium/sodium antiporter [Desulfobacterota bacterium AH_259_B03_O07]|nr:calcium/sodium antiporter [Desulfobacterota bacterium AH_259_B03_O07]
MEIFINSLLFIIGLIALYFGGEGLVLGSSRIARRLRINPIVIGLTIVALGTSSPEFVVSLIAAFKGSSDLAIGNIIGSNISNIGLILGISALIYPIKVQIRVIKAEVPIMIVLSIILYFTAFNLTIGFYEGIILIGSLLAFVIYSYFGALKESSTTEREFKEFLGTNQSGIKNFLFIISGIIGLIIGAHLVVNAAILTANELGISQLVIGVSAVAVGTSLPELSTSIVAAIRKEPDILVGNIIGSNIFNIGILGLVAIIHPVNVDPNILRFELPVMLFFTLAALPIMKTGFRVSRVEGIFLLAFYLLFIVLLFYL